MNLAFGNRVLVDWLRWVNKVLTHWRVLLPMVNISARLQCRVVMSEYLTLRSHFLCTGWERWSQSAWSPTTHNASVLRCVIIPNLQSQQYIPSPARGVIQTIVSIVGPACVVSPEIRVSVRYQCSIVQ